MRLPLLSILSLISTACFSADQVETPTPKPAVVAPSPAVDELTALKAQIAAMQAEKAAAVAAPETKIQPQYKPGCIVRIFMPNEGAKFPPDGWTPSEWNLVEMFSIPKIPQVDGFVEAGKPNHLVTSRTGALDGAMLYAVQFSGYFYAADEGEYTFSVRSDDPAQIQVADKVIALSKYSVPNPISRDRGDEYGTWALSEPAKLVNIAGGTFTAQAGRYYPISVFTWQQYRLGLAQDWRAKNTPDRGVERYPNELPPAIAKLGENLTGPVCGATLSVTVIAPNATETRQVKIYLLAKPNDKKP